MRWPTGREPILFVDDEEPIARLGQQMLERLGYKVETRTSCVEALAAFEARPENYDVVMTDMTMPNMTGDKLAKELMKARADIPVILCTGSSYQVDPKKAKRIGVQAFIMKPFIMKEIAETIRTVLDG